MVAAVWLATIDVRGDSMQSSLGISPSIADDRAQVVVRLDDSFTALWRTLPDSVVADRLSARLAPLLALADSRGVSRRTLQLDYDSPVRLLPRYAALVRALRKGVLAGRTVWVTSLVSHVVTSQYGALFTGVADGHIVQLFDTGDTFTPAAAQRLARALKKSELPFMIGVGAFERRLSGGRSTQHRAWFDVVPDLATLTGYRGMWVFPAGEPYVRLLPRL